MDPNRPRSDLSARDRFIALLHTAVREGQVTKLTLGKPRGADPTLRNLLVRPVSLKAGPHLALVWRHATRDITKNLEPAAALRLLEPMIGADFLDAHLFTPSQNAQFESSPGGGRLKLMPVIGTPAQEPAGHDRERRYLIPATTPWLHPLGITNAAGTVREGQSAKFRQINKFAELLTHLLPEAFPGFNSADLAAAAGSAPLQVADMGCGKGYLTFAVAALLDARALVTGIEARPELVETCNRVAREHRFANLSFVAGQIAPEVGIPESKTENRPDVLIALHACDTATDDALAHAIAARSRLILVSPCCHKELRPQLVAPAVLAPALRHGILHERQAEFVTDALRSLLLEWAGYRTKVFEFISTEHTAKNLMIAAVRTGGRQAPDSPAAAAIRALASFHGIREQRLAAHLGFSLA